MVLILSENITASGKKFVPYVVNLIIIYEYYIFYYGSTTLVGLGLLCEVPR
jgi:hypothetical protein